MDLPPLQRISSLQALPTPTCTIKTDDDVEKWKTTRGYADYALFLRRLSESVVGHFLPCPIKPSQSVMRLFGVLDELERWTEDIPPLPTPQRFGNLAFRTWGRRLDERAVDLLGSLLPAELAWSVPHLQPYFLISFGSFTRMDYGTGHEAAFALFLLCLVLIGFFDDSQSADGEAAPGLETERQLALLIWPRYLALAWRLQDVYRLEPAGSHGVWGLDDSHFIGYILGAAQLRGQNDIPPSAALSPTLPRTNLYFMQIARIRQVKTGPFHEHSSQLHSIATAVPNWGKVHQGLLKMYAAEVLGKRVVVQHVPLGGIVSWDAVPSLIHAGDNIARTSTSATAPWSRDVGLPSVSSRGARSFSTRNPLQEPTARGVLSYTSASPRITETQTAAPWTTHR